MREVRYIHARRWGRTGCAGFAENREDLVPHESPRPIGISVQILRDRLSIIGKCKAWAPRQSEIMNATGRITRAGFAWLTAIMTLVTSLPHFRCQCPNGSIKPFCFGVFCSSTGCCCGDACSGATRGPGCNAKPAAAGIWRAACCCGHTGNRPTRNSGDPAQVQAPGCQKTLAQQHLAPAAPTKVVHDGAAVDSFLPALAAWPRLDSAHTRAAKKGLHSAAPPPSDLVIVLQRFLI